MDWIDTHCHLNIAEYFPDPEPAIREALAVGVRRLVLVGIDLESSRCAVEMASRFEGVYAVVGFHPTEVAGFSPAWVDPLRDLALQPKVVAIGEIGLDYHWDRTSPADQEVALLAQLDLSEELGLPVVYHCRDAYDTLIALVERRPVSVPQLFHCFVGDMDQAKRVTDLGGWFGVDGPITFKNAHALREMVASLPRDRVVLETDSPFLTPHPFRGKPNSPAKIPLIGEGLAAVWGVPAAEVAASTTKAAEQFFRLPSWA